MHHQVQQNFYYEVMEDEIQGTTPVYDRSSLHEKRKKMKKLVSSPSWWNNFW